MATTDGFIPVIDPFADAGKYDPCDRALQGSQLIGAVAREAMISAAGGAALKAVTGAANYAQIPRLARPIANRLALAKLVNSSVPPALAKVYRGANLAGQIIGAADTVDQLGEVFGYGGIPGMGCH